MLAFIFCIVSITAFCRTESFAGEVKIVSIQAGEVTSAGYRVTAGFVATAGVKEVLMPTWTSSNGQDDLIWHEAQVSGNTAAFYVPVSAHKGESGTYITHVYVRDCAGKEVLDGIEITVPSSGKQIIMLGDSRTVNIFQSLTRTADVFPSYMFQPISSNCAASVSADEGKIFPDVQFRDIWSRKQTVRAASEGCINTE